MSAFFFQALWFYLLTPSLPENCAVILHVRTKSTSCFCPHTHAPTNVSVLLFQIYNQNNWFQIGILSVFAELVTSDTLRKFFILSHMWGGFKKVMEQSNYLFCCEFESPHMPWGAWFLHGPPQKKMSTSWSAEPIKMIPCRAEGMLQMCLSLRTFWVGRLSWNVQVDSIQLCEAMNMEEEGIRKGQSDDILEKERFEEWNRLDLPLLVLKIEGLLDQGV